MQPPASPVPHPAARADRSRLRALVTTATLLAAVSGVVIACGGCTTHLARGDAHAHPSTTSAGALSSEMPQGDRHATSHVGQTRRASLGALDAATRADSRPESAVRRHLQAFAPGTYIGELLDQRDSALTRWPERVDQPLTVWVATAEGHTGWNASYVREVVAAFRSWERLDIPVRFRFVDDSAAADVHVRWTDRFAEPISGRTVWSRDDHWWMTDANITLALHHRDGAPLDDDQIRAITLHEVGHLLGLDHTTDGSNVMAARVRVRDLSDADAATVRLLYSLPAGHVN